MQTGRLDQRVTIERFTSTTDAWGGTVEAWSPLATVWAGVEPLVGREYFAADAAQSEVTAKIRMRYRPGITPQDRVVHKGRNYNIVSVIDVRSAGRELVLMVKG